MGMGNSPYTRERLTEATSSSRTLNCHAVTRTWCRDGKGALP